MGTKQSREEERGNPILVMKDKDGRNAGTGMRFAHVLPNKGVDDYAVQIVMKNLERLGHKRVIMKNDQEPAIIALRTAVKARSTVEVIPEESPIYESASNGEIENTIRTVQDQIRTVKDALESRIGERIDKEENVITWMVMHAA